MNSSAGVKKKLIRPLFFFGRPQSASARISVSANVVWMLCPQEWTVPFLLLQGSASMSLTKAIWGEPLPNVTRMPVMAMPDS